MRGARGVVLRLDDAAAIHRWLEFIVDGRTWFNPIEAYEANRAMLDAKGRLESKLIATFAAVSPSRETPPTEEKR